MNDNYLILLIIERKTLLPITVEEIQTKMDGYPSNAEFVGFITNHDLDESCKDFLKSLNIPFHENYSITNWRKELK